MRSRMLLVGSCFGLLAIACAASATPAGNGGDTARLQAVEEARPLPEVPDLPPPTAQGTRRVRAFDPRTTEADDALDGHDYAKVLSLTESPSSGHAGAWLDFDRASALTGLGRIDEAVEAYKRAELRFAGAGDDQGRAVSIWGRARALDEVGRCPEARRVYQQYESFVRLSDPRAAEMAAAYSGVCRPLAVQP